MWQASQSLEPASSSTIAATAGAITRGGPAANHIDRFAADVVLLLDKLGIERTAFWGYSTAINVGLRVADEHPSRIERLVMSGAIRTGTVTREELSALVADAVGTYRARGWEALIEGFEADEGPVPEWMKERIRATDLEPVIGWNEARPDWGWSAWDALQRVRAPGLFLAGALEAAHERHEPPGGDPFGGPMTVARRVAALEAALSPTQLVLRWLDEAHAFGDVESYVRSLLDAEPGDLPLDRLCHEAQRGARASLRSRRGDEVDRAIASALRQTVFRFELVIVSPDEPVRDRLAL